MGNVSLDSFRAMASGVGGFESVAVVTNSKTNELALEGRNVRPASDENIRTRETLVSLMAADLRASFGVDDGAVRQFIETLREDLVGSHGAEALDRGGALSKAFDTFDAFKVKKLTERKFTRDVESAERSFLYKKMKYVSDLSGRLKSATDSFYKGKTDCNNLLKCARDGLEAFKQNISKGFESVEKLYQTVRQYGQQLDTLANGAGDLTDVEREQLRQLLQDAEWKKVEGDAQEPVPPPDITQARNLLQKMASLKTLQSRKQFWDSLVENDSAPAPDVAKNDPDAEWKKKTIQDLDRLRNTCRHYQTAVDSLQKVANYLLNLEQPLEKDEKAEEVFKKAVSDDGNKDKAEEEMALFREDKNMKGYVQLMMDKVGEFMQAKTDDEGWRGFKEYLAGGDENFKKAVEEVKQGDWGFDVVQDLNKLKTAIGDATQKKEAAAKYFDSSSDGFKQGMEAVEKEYDRLLRSLSERGKSSISDRLKVLCRQAGVKISDKTFVRFITERRDAIKQTAFALIGGADLKGEKLSAQNAIVQAIRTLRDIEIRAGKGKRADVPLNANDQTLVNFLVKSNDVESLKEFLRDNAGFRKCLNEVLQGGFRLLASFPKTDKSVTLLIPVSADGKKKENITLLQSNDNKLRFSYKGRTYEMASTAAQMYLRIKDSTLVEPLSDEEWQKYYDETSSDTDPEVRDRYQNFQGEVPERVNQEVAVARVDEMLKALRECNNANPGVYGGAPHFMNKMPRLDPKCSNTVKVFGLFDTGRTETFLRTYCNQQIENGGRLTRWFWKRFAGFLNVPLQTGSANSGSNTLFEKAALFLNQLRLFAQNANYIRSRFEEKEAPGRSEAKILEEACLEFGRLTQFTLHPEYKGEKMHRLACLAGYKDALVLFYKAFKKSKESNQLNDFFKMLTDGACFNGCSQIIEDYVMNKFNMAPNYDDNELFRPSASVPSDVAQPEKPDDNAQANGVNVQQPPADPEPANVQKESAVNAPEPAKDPVREAFETKKKNGKLVIDPDLEPKHTQGESVFGYLRRELNALNETFNPPGTTEPKVFTWDEAKLFLKERLMQHAQKELDQKWDGFQKMGQNQILKLRTMTVEQRREWKKSTLDPAVKNGSMGALWLQTFLDMEKLALRENAIREGRLIQKQELGDMLDKPAEPNAPGVRPPNTVVEQMIKKIVPDYSYVDESGTVQTKKITDFLSVAEKLLREDKLIADDDKLLFLRNDDIVKASPPEPAAAEPQEKDLQIAFETKKKAGEPAIDPNLAKNLHEGRENTLDFLVSEIKTMYSTFNPPGTHNPKVFSWEKVKSFLQERLAGIDAAARKKAAAEKLRELQTRPEKLQQILLSANDNLVPLLQNLNWGKDFLNRFLTMSVADRQKELNSLKKNGPQKWNWLQSFVSGKNLKTEFSLKDSAQKWLEDFAYAGNAERRKLAGELLKEGGEMVTLVRKFVNLDNVAFEKDFVNEEGRAVQTKIMSRLEALTNPASINEEEKAKALLAAENFLSARLARFVERQRSIIADAREELTNLTNPDYLKREVEKARQEGGLKLFFDLEDVQDRERIGMPELKFEKYYPGYTDGEEGVDLEYYQATELVSCGCDDPHFWNMVETCLKRNQRIKVDDKLEFVNGGEGIRLTVPKEGDSQFVKIRLVTDVDDENAPWEYYDPVKHGTDFIQVRDEKGDHSFVWRSPDGRYQVLGGQLTKLNGIADIAGDAEYKKGDVYIKE